MNWRSQWFIALTLAIGGMGVTTWMVLTPPKTEPQPRVQFVPVVRVHPVSISNERISVYSQGTVTPVATWNFLAEVGGRVVSTAPQMTDGGFFRNGDKLLQIERRPYELEVTKARAAVESARLRLAQAQALTRTGGVPGLELSPLARGEPQLLDAESAVSAALAALELAEIQLARTEVTATFDGRVRRRLAQVGQYVAPGTPLAEAYATDVAEVRLPISPQQMALLANLNASEVARGAPEVELRDPEGGAVWKAALVRAEGEIDATTQLVYVVAEVRDPYGMASDGEHNKRSPLMAGAYVEAKIEGRDFPGIVVLPRDAIAADDQVWIVNQDNRLEVRPVSILHRGRDVVYVAAGLSAGENVLLTRLDTPIVGQRVEIMSSAPNGLGQRPHTTETAPP